MPYKDPTRQRAWYVNCYRRRRNHALLALGNHCASCGTQNAAPLQLHHKDKAQKTFSYRNMANVSEARFLAELSHTIILCVICHDRLHTAERAKGTDPATISDDEWNTIVNPRQP